MYYGDKRESLVKLSDGLRSKGWKIYGFKEDKSDMMTDYYDPAYWGGVAVKNGFILVVDNCSGGTIGGDFIRTSYDPKIAKRIQKLQTLADNHAASEGERNNALAMIEKFDKNLIVEVLEKGSLPEVKYQKNPGNSKWHIERDGNIIAKGTGVFQFSDINTWREERVVYDDFETSKWMLDSYFHFTNAEDWAKNQEYRKEENLKKSKSLDKYFALLEKWNNLVAIKIGDGEEEKLVKKLINKTTTYLIVEKSSTPTSYVRIGEKWKRACGLEKGIVYKLSDDSAYISKLTRKWVTLKDGTHIHSYSSEPRKNTKPGYFSGGLEDWESGHFEYVKLVPVVETISEEVWVKEKTTSRKNTKKETKKVSSSNQKESSIDNDQKYENLIEDGQIVDFEHTRTGKILKVLKIEEKLSSDEFKSFLHYLKVNNIAYYSKYAKGFVLSEDYLDDMEEAENNEEPKDISTQIKISAFDIARLGQEQLYEMAEQNLLNKRIKIEIREMKMTPVEIKDSEVLYECCVVDYVTA